MAARNGLMIDYDFCTGCNSCVVACKQEHSYPVGKGGINLVEIMTPLPDDRIRVDYIPFTTAYCDLCYTRTTRGEQPACVKHCQAACMYFGTLPELAAKMETKPHCVLFTPR